MEDLNALLEAAIQSYFHFSNDASLAECIYGLRRVNLSPASSTKILSHRQRFVNLFLTVKITHILKRNP